MRVLVQDCKTAEFLNLDGSRIKAAAEAHDFHSTLTALEFCGRIRSSDLQILLKFERSELDVTLPISATCKETQAQ